MPRGVYERRIIKPGSPPRTPESRKHISQGMLRYWALRRSLRALAANPEALTRFNALTGDEARGLVTRSRETAQAR